MSPKRFPVPPYDRFASSACANVMCCAVLHFFELKIDDIVLPNPDPPPRVVEEALTL